MAIITLNHKFASDDTPVHAEPAIFSIGLLNLMPNKKVCERQFARVFQASGRNVHLVRLKMATHISKSGCIEKLDTAYTPVSIDVLDQLDGLIITGAPVEHLEFSQVDYWQELKCILDHLQTTNLATLFICWSAQAALFHYHGVQKHCLKQKLFGIYPQWKINASSALMTGIEDGFPTPASRRSTLLPLDILRCASLDLIAGSDRSGPALIGDRNSNFTYMLNHLEYAADTLHIEFQRDLARGYAISPPVNYSRAGQSLTSIKNVVRKANWQKPAVTLYSNWLEQVQQTSFKI